MNGRIVGIALLTAACVCAAVYPAKAQATFETDCAALALGSSAADTRLVDQRVGTDYVAHDRLAAWANAVKDGTTHTVSDLSFEGDRLLLTFGELAFKAVLRVGAREQYFVVEVLSVSGEPPDALTFVDMPLILTGEPGEAFACCALALNLQTNVVELPGAQTRLRATCYKRFGFEGARVALIACPTEALRDVMKTVVAEADGVPRSPRGGPWALDADMNRRSYLIDYPGSVSPATVDDWIHLAKALGVGQIDFHSGHTMRYGDYQPNPEVFPKGLAGLRDVIQRLHDAGIQAGLHTYAFYLGKDTPWVTPRPDPRLAKASTFTLAGALDEATTTVGVVESTFGISPITGFQVRNSATVQVDDELITFSGATQAPPFRFTECTRGACGTEATSHAPGAKVHHLKECFGLFAPDPDSTLFAEVAARTAEVYNTCGFDMIYLDALDGSDLLAGGECAWHYGAKFVFELWGRLDEPALMEMSVFTHHLWYVRSRIGAWDVPQRGPKRFIDMHAQSNQSMARHFLPTNLGWWAVFACEEVQRERTFPDTIEYLCCKSLGYDSSLSWLLGFDPKTFPTSRNQQQLAAMVRQYEELRLADHFPESVRSELRAPGSEFTLEKDAEGEWRFRRVEYVPHKVSFEKAQQTWDVENPFNDQPLRVRIESLMSARPYDASDRIVLADFTKRDEFGAITCAEGVSAELAVGAGDDPEAEPVARFTARNNDVEPTAAWAGVSKTFSPYLNISGHQGIGVWIHGDGKGEVLNFQTRCPVEAAGAIAERYVDVDFEGWRYFELVEPEGNRLHEYSWPYAGGLYRIWSDFRRIESLSLWYTNLPRGEEVSCLVRPVAALPIQQATFTNPSVAIGRMRLVLPVQLESGQYIEFRSMQDCSVYDAKGEPIAKVAPQGDCPVLESGANHVTIACDAPSTGITPRARVTVTALGETLTHCAS